ncbi:uncharacterized protein LOC142224376 isoform X1 [Haematobia irritans]|uniref:uncharacterized protein LOC142224376 isoform X1 n=1 Tax=Haematobia irritans TaxID=7368 RepID=UPI003F4F9E88
MQNKMLRRCLGVSFSTPNHVVYALAHELPPSYRARLLTAKELIKIQYNNWNLYDTISDNPKVKSSYSKVYYDFKNIFDNIKHVSNPIFSNIISVRFNLLSGSKKDTPIEALKVIYNKEIADYKADDYDIYATDASVGSSSTGCGVLNVNYDQKFHFKIDTSMSSTFGELWALVKALEIAIEDESEKCVFFTDSLAACKIIASVKTNNYIAASFHEKVVNSNIKKCQIVWIPGHSGIKINEVADDIAKLAREVGAPIRADLIPEEAIRKIEICLWNEWNRYLQ